MHREDAGLRPTPSRRVDRMDRVEHQTNVVRAVRSQAHVADVEQINGSAEQRNALEARPEARLQDAVD
jgi:hypothetical protein